jgi:hypothetical protein
MYTPSKMSNSLSWLIGGAQGSRVDSAANIFSRACAQGDICIRKKRVLFQYKRRT